MIPLEQEYIGSLLKYLRHGGYMRRSTAVALPASPGVRVGTDVVLEIEEPTMTLAVAKFRVRPTNADSKRYSGSCWIYETGSAANLDTADYSVMYTGSSGNSDFDTAVCMAVNSWSPPATLTFQLWGSCSTASAANASAWLVVLPFKP